MTFTATSISPATLSYCFSSSLPFFVSVNNTEELKKINLLPNETSVILDNLKYSTRYKFTLNAMTIEGTGPVVTTAITIMDEGEAEKKP